MYFEPKLPLEKKITRFCKLFVNFMRFNNIFNFQHNMENVPVISFVRVFITIKINSTHL